MNNAICITWDMSMTIWLWLMFVGAIVGFVRAPKFFGLEDGTLRDALQGALLGALVGALIWICSMLLLVKLS